MKTLSLTTDPIPQLTWSIALPLSVGMLFSTLFNVVDTVCAGWLGTDASAALALSFPPFFILFSIGSGISQSTTVLMSTAIGRGDATGARKIFSQTLILTLAAGLSASVAGLLAAPRLFHFLGAEGEYFHTSMAYMNVILAGGVCFMLPMVFNAALSANGNTRPYRNFLITGFVLNLLLNPVLMWGLVGLPRMGVAGIALATVIVQFVGISYLGCLVLRSSVYEGFHLKDLIPDPAVQRDIVHQALPAVMNMLTLALGAFVVTWFAKHFGKEAVAAGGIAARVEQFLLMPTVGLNAALLSIVGQNHGAGLPERIRLAWRNNVKAGVVMLILGAGALALFREPVMSWFTSDEVVMSKGRDWLLAAAFTLPAYPVLFATVFTMQALKRPAYGLWLGLYRQLAAPLLVIHWLAFGVNWGLSGVWWGVCIVTWSAAMLALWHGHRQTHKLVLGSPA